MKKILVIESGLKPGWTKKTADLMIECLSTGHDYEFKRVNLRDETIQPCLGCGLCLERGEDHCKNYADSTNKILQKMLWADGIITVTPNYALQVPWNLKNLYDRLAFVFHRPRLFGKISMAIVVQGVYGGNKIVKYINEVMGFWGCDSVKGAVVFGGLFPQSHISQTVQNKNMNTITASARRFSQAMEGFKLRQPSFLKLAIFRAARTSMKYSSDVLPADKKYFMEKGWMESPYYYQINLGPIRRLFGMMIDQIMKRMVVKREKREA